MSNMLKLFSICIFLCNAAPSFAYNQCDAGREIARRAEGALKVAEAEYRRASINYEKALVKRDATNINMIRAISTIDAQLAALLGKLGIEGITVLTNKLTCDDPDFETFCNTSRKGRFFSIAGKYAATMGRKVAATKKLSTNDITLSGQARRQYVIAFNAWADTIRKQNAYVTAQNNLAAVVACVEPQAAIPNCTPANPADMQAALTNPSRGPVNANPGCAYPPASPPAKSTLSNGCHSLLGGVGEAVGLTICTNRLLDVLNG